MQTYTVQLIDNWRDLVKLKEEWAYVLSLSLSNTIFMTWEWIETWKNDRSDYSLFVIVLRNRNLQVVAIAPFYIAQLKFLYMTRYKCLRILGDTDTGAEYQTLLVAKGEEREALDCIISFLAAHIEQWDCIWLPKQATWNTAYHNLITIVRKSPLRFYSRPIGFATLMLPDSMQLFWEQQSRSNRSNLRRLERKFSHESIEVSRCDSMSVLNTYIEVLLDLHQKRWRQQGEDGAFVRRPKAVAFFQRFIPFALANGWLRFYMLRVSGIPRAIQLGFVYGKSFFVVQEGFDPDYISGIGNLLRVRIIEQCIEENIIEYDFLAGFTEHKRRWGSTERFGADMFIWNNKPKNAIFSLYRFWPSGRFLKLVH